MMKSRRVAITVGVVSLLAALMVGCEDETSSGPAGTVTAREHVVKCKKSGKRSTKCKNKYYLATTPNSGGPQSAEFGVSPDVYEKCVRGGQYPRCTEK